jgi:hypothetical protein
MNPDDQDWAELSEAARRGLQRAAIHLVQAAIEIVAGIGAFLEEIGADGSEEDPDDGVQRIEVD